MLEQQLNVQLPRLGICHDTCGQETACVVHVFVVLASKAISEKPLPSQVKYLV
jgi:hypothetical protein